MKIDKGFYINLSYRTDRNEMIKAQLEKVGWTDLVERYEAVDGNSQYGQSVKCSPGTEAWTSVASSALKSHRNVIQYAKDNNLDNVLILEDDCMFYDRVYTPELIKVHNFQNYPENYSVNGLEVINSALSQMDVAPNWNILLLGCTILPLPPEEITPLELVAPNVAKIERALSCHSYIVSHRAYDKLIDLANGELVQEKFGAMMDVLWNNIDEKYSVYPHAVVQQPTGITDIGGVPGVGPLYWDHNYDRQTVKLY